jgi:hypothetical protein
MLKMARNLVDYEAGKQSLMQEELYKINCKPNTSYSNANPKKD